MEHTTTGTNPIETNNRKLSETLCKRFTRAFSFQRLVFRSAGSDGAVCATLGVVLPSFVIILIVAKFYEKFRKSRAVDGVMYGLRPAVIGLIVAAFLSVGMTVFFPNGLKTAVFSGAGFWLSLGIFALGAVLAFKKLHPIAIIGISAVIGIIAGYAFDL